MPKKLQNNDKIEAKRLSLNLKDLAALIKTCKKNKVLSLEYEGLKLILSPADKKPIKMNQAQTYVDANKPTPTIDNGLDREETLEHLIITDPDRYEKYIQNGDFDAGN